MILAPFHAQKKLLKVSDHFVEKIQHESTTLSHMKTYGNMALVQCLNLASSGERKQ